MPTPQATTGKRKHKRGRLLKYAEPVQPGDFKFQCRVCRRHIADGFADPGPDKVCDACYDYGTTSINRAKFHPTASMSNPEIFGLTLLTYGPNISWTDIAQIILGLTSETWLIDGAHAIYKTCRALGLPFTALAIRRYLEGAPMAEKPKPAFPIEEPEPATPNSPIFPSE